MREIRLFVEQVINVGDEIILNGENHRYLNKVLRLRKDDLLILINNTDYDYQAKILLINKKESVLVVESKNINQNTPQHDLILCIALLKGHPMDFVLQKSVELGVTRIVPMVTERSERKIKSADFDKKKQHWLAILQASALQCRRAEIPDLDEPSSIEDTTKLFTESEKWILSPYQTDRQITENEKKSSLAIMIGPEGGFSDDEVNISIENKWIPKQYGSRILRADTAAIVGLAFGQHYFNYF